MKLFSAPKTHISLGSYSPPHHKEIFVHFLPIYHKELQVCVSVYTKPLCDTRMTIHMAWSPLWLLPFSSYTQIRCQHAKVHVKQ